jgi:signal transduction histidine kinase
MGIEEKELRNIFQRFYRTRRAEASGEKGTGIGLSIVDQIVRQHRGRIDVASRVGEGSCFTMIVPADVPSRESPPSVGSGPVRIEK